MNDDSVIAGQAVYSKRVLSIYDIWVLGISNHYLWKCPTRLIGDQFLELVSTNHLDVGVGSGYYLKNYLPADTRRIALVDLNENSLKSASKAIQSFDPEIHCRNALEPLELGCERFDSVSIKYLLHCLPGDMSGKSIIFSNLKSVMNDGGVLFGSTILGKGAEQNIFARWLMSFYNKKGIFSNENDGLDVLVASLEENFSDVKVEVVGSVALFSGRVA